MSPPDDDDTLETKPELSFRESLAERIKKSVERPAEPAPEPAPEPEQPNQDSED
jgi:hypothetical protein